MERERSRVIRKGVTSVRDGHHVEVSDLRTNNRVVTERIRNCTGDLSSLCIHHRETSAADTSSERIDRTAADRRRGWDRQRRRLERDDRDPQTTAGSQRDRP